VRRKCDASATQVRRTVPCARGMLDWRRRKLSASEHLERKGIFEWVQE